jgi:hypothetical protein
LCGGVGLFRNRLTTAPMQWIKRMAGGIIVGFGVAALG